MLSYQHGFHAGNMADVHKHSLLAWMLAYMCQKPKPLTYIETHAGRGLYDLGSDAARKTGEAAQGISIASGWFPADHPYQAALAQTRAEHGPDAYPGSPLIAAMAQRDGDHMHLSELHPQEHAALAEALFPFGEVAHKRDGFEMALSVTPPMPRRGLLLIDPSFEIKTDYETIPQTLARIHRKWNVGTLVLWYPILTDAPHAAMLRTLRTDFSEGITHEVAFPPARAGHRMTGSGLFVVNAPYGFDKEAARLSAYFAKLTPQPRA